MKRTLLLFSAVLMLLFALTGCTRRNNADTNTGTVAPDSTIVNDDDQDYTADENGMTNENGADGTAGNTSSAGTTGTTANGGNTGSVNNGNTNDGTITGNMQDAVTNAGDAVDDIADGAADAVDDATDAVEDAAGARRSTVDRKARSAA